MSYYARIRRVLRGARRIRFGTGPEAAFLPVQACRLASSFLARGFTPLEFYLYGFWKRGASSSGYIPNRWIEAEFRPRLNPLEHARVLKDKLLFYDFGRQNGLPVAEIVAFFHPSQPPGVSVPHLRTGSDLGHLFTDRPDIRHLVAKPVAALGGKGVVLLEVVSPDRLLDLGSGRQLTCDGLADLLKADIALRQPGEDSASGYLLQERVSCHPAMNPLEGRALNTVRIATLRDSAGDIHADFAMLRLARPEAVSDNLHRGGTVAGIELDTGAITSPAYGYETEAGPWLETRPTDVASLFSDRKVPGWPEMLGLARRCHSCLPGLGSIGWDIALTDDGPLALEGNDNWDMVIAQVISGPYLTDRRKGILLGLGLRLP